MLPDHTCSLKGRGGDCSFARSAAPLTAVASILETSTVASTGVPARPLSVPSSVPFVPGSQLNATVESLRGDLANALHVIDSLADNNDMLSGQVSLLSDQVSQLSDQVSELKDLLLQLLPKKKVQKTSPVPAPGAPAPVPASDPTAAIVPVPAPATAPVPAVAPVIIHPCRYASKGGCSGPVKQIRPKPKGSVDAAKPIDSVTNPAGPPAPAFGICEGHDKHKK